ncbi:hypothetical protein KP78_18510 [Jeotgalibacillus soli]|uniref:Uncharacterized protein n=1 Tax=Jeotgalibacillus soli TaxID=889306 RepID=A0A0C2VRW0_9BACL|nr:hypothetical protein KP78_18510 [Jeotgalibacillus soli]
MIIFSFIMFSSLYFYKLLTPSMKEMELTVKHHEKNLLDFRDNGVKSNV